MLNEIKKVVHDNNINFFGIGDIKQYSGNLSDFGYPVSMSYSKSISIGVTLINTIVDQLSINPEILTIELYRHFCYDLINQRIDNTLLKIAETLIKNGYDALPIHASKTTDKSKLFGTFSHKAAAYLSGLGWIGKSCLLINMKVGPRARWGTILTNAPLKSTGKPIEENCKNCNVCVQSCPASAFSGKNFNIQDKREIRYDAFKCHDYLSRMREKTGYRVCGICVQVCPFGNKTNHMLIV